MSKEDSPIKQEKEGKKLHEKIAVPEYMVPSFEIASKNSAFDKFGQEMAEIYRSMGRFFSHSSAKAKVTSADLRSSLPLQDLDEYKNRLAELTEELEANRQAIEKLNEEINGKAQKLSVLIKNNIEEDNDFVESTKTIKEIAGILSLAENLAEKHKQVKKQVAVLYQLEKNRELQLAGAKDEDELRLKSDAVMSEITESDENCRVMRKQYVGWEAFSDKALSFFTGGRKRSRLWHKMNNDQKKKEKLYMDLRTTYHEESEPYVSPLAISPINDVAYVLDNFIKNIHDKIYKKDIEIVENCYRQLQSTLETDNFTGAQALEMLDVEKKILEIKAFYRRLLEAVEDSEQFPFSSARNMSGILETDYLDIKRLKEEAITVRDGVFLLKVYERAKKDKEIEPEKLEELKQYFVQMGTDVAFDVDKGSFAQTHAVSFLKRLKASETLPALYLVALQGSHPGNNAMQSILSLFDDRAFRAEAKEKGGPMHDHLKKLYQEKDKALDYFYSYAWDDAGEAGKFLLSNMDNPRENIRKVIPGLLGDGVSKYSAEILRQILTRLQTGTQTGQVNLLDLEALKVKALPFQKMDDFAAANNQTVEFLLQLNKPESRSEFFSIGIYSKENIISYLAYCHREKEKLSKDKLEKVDKLTDWAIENLPETFFESNEQGFDLSETQKRRLIAVLTEQKPSFFLFRGFFINTLDEEQKIALMKSLLKNEPEILVRQYIIGDLKVPNKHEFAMAQSLVENSPECALNLYAAYEDHELFTHDQLVLLKKGCHDQHRLMTFCSAAFKKGGQELVASFFVEDEKEQKKFIKLLKKNFALGFTGEVGTDGAGRDNLTPFLAHLMKENDFDLNDETYQLFFDYISLFGLSSSKVLFDYYRNIINLKEGLIKTLPEDQARAGIFEVTDLEKRAKKIRRALISGTVPSAEEMSAFDYELLNIETRFEVSRWAKPQISLIQLHKDFCELESKGKIEPLRAGYEKEVFQVKKVETGMLNFDHCREEYSRIRQELLLAVKIASGKGMDQIKDKIVEQLQAELDQIVISPSAHEKEIQRLQTRQQLVSECLAKLKDIKSIDQIMKLLLDLELNLNIKKEFAPTSPFLRTILFSKAIANHSGYANLPEAMSMGEEPTLESLHYIKDIIQNMIKQHIILTGELRQGKKEEPTETREKRLVEAAAYFDEGYAPGAPESKRLAKVFSVPNINEFLQNREEKATGQEQEISMIPDRGVVGELSGYYADACWTSQYMFLRDWPNITPYKFVMETEDDVQKIIGSVLLIETESRSGEKVLVVRGLNPRDEFLNGFQAADFCEKVFEKVKSTAERIGAKKVLVALKSGSTSNRGSINSYASNYGKDEFFVPLQESVNFNNYEIQEACYQVRTV